MRTPESKAGTEIDDSWDFLPELNITPPVGFYTGKLTVRLSPHPEDKDVTPFLNLSVTVHMPTNVRDPPVIFVHCGGPGSGVECVNNKVMLDNKSKARYSGYAVVAIDQRGVGSDTNPSFECDMKQLKEPPPGKTSYDISDFTSCPCALPDGTPLVDEAFANLDPMDEDQVHELFQKMACAESWTSMLDRTVLR